MYMLQSVWKLSPFANGVTFQRQTGSQTANGLTFQVACKRPRPFVTRLDAKDRFRLCVDLTSLSIVRTMYRPYMRESPRDIFIVLLLRAERKARREGTEIQSETLG